MLTYSLNCQKNTKKCRFKSVNTKNGETMLSSTVLYVAVKNQDS